MRNVTLSDGTEATILAERVPFTLYAHPKASERVVDWTALSVNTSATDGGYGCGVAIIVNPKLYRALLGEEPMPEGLLAETMEVLHRRMHEALLGLLGEGRRGENEEDA